MAVVFDVAGSAGVAFTATTISFTLTVGSSANRAAQLQLTQAANNASSITCSLGAVSGVLVTGSDSGTTITTDRTAIYSVIAPPSGAGKTARADWTNAITTDLGVFCASGVDQTTPCNNGTFSAAASSGSTTATLSVTSVSGDLPAACVSVYSDGLTSLSPFTTKWGIDSASTAGSVGAGTGTQVFTTVRPFASDPFAISGANFKAVAGGATRGLFRVPGLSGLGVGGSFFRDALQFLGLAGWERLTVRRG